VQSAKCKVKSWADANYTVLSLCLLFFARRAKNNRQKK
jgi:hypothetical protein